MRRRRRRSFFSPFVFSLVSLRFSLRSLFVLSSFSLQPHDSIVSAGKYRGRRGVLPVDQSHPSVRGGIRAVHGGATFNR